MTAARRLLIAALLAIPPLMVLAVAALYPSDQIFPNQGDLNLYLTKAMDLAGGGIPYRDFGLEYPPLALLPMAVPYLVGSLLGTVDLDAYKWLFAGWEAGLLAVLGFVLVRISRLVQAGHEPGADRAPGTALQLIVLTAGALLAITFRFDLFPTLLMAVALWAALERRPAWAGVAVALGVLAKLFPIAILPAIAIPWLLPLQPRPLARLGGAVVATGILGLAPFVLLAGLDNTLQFLRYNGERGLEVETIGGGLAVLGGLLAGRPIEYDYSFSSVNADGPFAQAWLALLPALTLVGFGVLGLLAWRRMRTERAALGAVRPGTIVTLATVSVVLLLATAKVYSIQYVVWLVPLLALLRGRQFWLGAAIVALTMPIHPLLFAGLVRQEALPILVLNARNGLLLALLVWLLHDLAQRSGAAARIERP